MNKWVFIITFNQYSSLFIGENATGGPSPQHACTKPALALLPGPAHVSIARGRAATYADAGAAPFAAHAYRCADGRPAHFAGSPGRGA